LKKLTTNISDNLPLTLIEKYTAFSALCIECSNVLRAYYGVESFKTARIPAITAKRATPSTNAAVRIMLARISFAASG
jgi:hypothetical protein